MLAQFTDIALASAPAGLLSEQAARRVRAAARELPAVNWAGLEGALGAGQERVDFHLGIRPGTASLKRVIRHCEERGDHPRLLEFCREWDDPTGPLAGVLSSVILEYDLPDDDAVAAPAVFFAFEDRLTAPERFTAARHLLRHFFGRQHEEIPALERCFSSCRGEERITHIGLMLSRADTAVRVNVRNLAHARLGAYLRAVEYTGDHARLEREFHTFVRYVDRVTVCLDVGAGVLPRVGLECTLVSPPAADSRHQFLLAELVRRALCTETQAAGILAWPGVSAPLHHIENWPEFLLVESLTTAPETFTALGRSISHIKIDLRPDVAPAAKAYLGYEHTWLEPGRDLHPARRGALSSGVATSRSTDDSIDAALGFLLEQRHQGGWWRDYAGIPTHLGDEFLTAYIGYVLSTFPNGRARAAAMQAWELLERCGRASDGWGYNRWTAADADSTGWTLQLARSLGVQDSEAVARGEQFLQQHIRADGGVGTYNEAEFRAFNDRGKSVLPDRRQWCESHVCVTAAALPLIGGTEAIAWLERAQDPTGAWVGCWWPDAEFPTALAVRALCEAGGEANAPRVRNATEWTARRVGEDGSVFSSALGEYSPFAAGCCLSILTFAPAALSSERTGSAAQRLARWLTAGQRADGSWTPSALMFPAPFGQAGAPVPDENGLHTTATVLWALQRFRSAGGGA